MTPANRSDLLLDTLETPALAESLAATRAAARRRRIARRTGRLGALALVLATGAAVLLRHPAREQSVATLAPPPVARPGFITLTTQPDMSPASPRLSSPPALVVTTSTSGISIVSTRSAPEPATESDLFAAAGSRPAALQRHPDGTSTWIWLDRRP